MAITTAANSKFSIGTTVGAGLVAADYTSDTYVPIANISDMGEAGSKAEIVVGKYVDQTFNRKIKGSRDNGTISLVVARDSADTGYQALIAAEKTSFSYNFKIELADKPSSGASPKNSFFYFKAIVASASNKFGGSDDIVQTTFELAITGPIVEVIASAT